MTTREISTSDEVIDLRDVIAHFEELETELQDACEGEGNGTEFGPWIEAMAGNDAGTLQDAAIEYQVLHALLDDLKGYGGDEQWRGDWYPVTLVRDSYFKEYAVQLAEDIGAINSDASWPNNCIDWDKAAHQLKQDYSTVEFDGVTYWYR